MKTSKNYSLHLIAFILLIAILVSSCGTGHCGNKSWRKKRYCQQDTLPNQKQYFFDGQGTIVMVYAND